MKKQFINVLLHKVKEKVKQEIRKVKTKANKK